MNNNIKAQIVDGNLIISLPLQAGAVSKSGKSVVVASTYGNKQVEAMFNGQNITIGVNAYVPVKK